LRVSQMQPEDAADLIKELDQADLDTQLRYYSVQDRQRQLDEDYNSGLLRVEDWGAQSQELGNEIRDIRSETNDLNRRRNNVYRYFASTEDGALIRNETAEPFVPEAPVVSSTNEVTQLAIRQALLDAANSPQNYLTFGTGDMAIAATGGKSSGQRKYYDEIIPRQLRETLRRLSREYDIEMPEIEQIRMYSNENDATYTVPGIRLTPELRQAIADYGMPMFKEGGMVNLKSGLASMANEVL